MKTVSILPFNAKQVHGRGIRASPYNFLRQIQGGIQRHGTCTPWR